MTPACSTKYGCPVNWSLRTMRNDPQLRKRRQRRSDHAPFGDDPRNQLRGGDIEGRVIDVDTFRRRTATEAVRDFVGRALFDWNLCTGGKAVIERAGGSGHVKRNAVSAGEQGDRVGANLVGDV